MKRSIAALIVLLVAMSMSAFAAKSHQNKPKLTVTYYYLPG